MDPQTTLNELLEACAERDWERAEVLSQALLDWLQHRGFPPHTFGPKKLGKSWHRAVATFVCHLTTVQASCARKRRRRRAP